jgi:hypothetical protein
MDRRSGRSEKAIDLDQSFDTGVHRLPASEREVPTNRARHARCRLERAMALTKTELKELRELLEAKHAELVDRVDRSIVARVGDRTFPDSMDAATRAQEEDELIELASRERTLVEEIDRALAMFDAGS